MTSFEHAVQLTNITVKQNDMVTIDSVTLTINKGNFAAIIGPNGAGKTTLVKVILGLIRPDSGTVKVFDRPSDELGELRSKIGYVPQIFSIDIKFPVTVFETVLMGTYGKLGVGKRVTSAEREATYQAMEKVGITDLKDRPIARLSGGQRQRAFIARALANNPDLLVLDEPTTGVDIATTGNLYALLRQLKSEGVTVLLVSHDVGVVASYIDTLACLNVSLVAHCRPGEVECTDALKSMYGCDVAFLHHGDAPHIVVEEHE
ncbi:MAG: metal ABC transporter ATP-binding protein [Armatimonadota bacterium]|nr:metal ABC transporter ATP-binding protein [bacterium]